MNWCDLAYRAPQEAIGRQRALLFSEQRLSSLLDALPAPVMLLNGHLQILFGNRAMAQYCAGQGVHRLEGRRLGEVICCGSTLHAEHGCGTAAACRNCGALAAMLDALQGDPASSECSVSQQAVQGGQPIEMTLRSVLLPWKPGPFILVTVDFYPGERQQVLQRVFLHDILNTAGSVSQIAEMLQLGILDFESAKGDLCQASQVLVHEIKGQFDLCAAVQEGMQVNFSMVLVGDLLDAVASLYRSTRPGLGRRISIREETPGLHFLSDASLLTRIIGNLLKNGLEAAHPGEAVTLGCRREGTNVVIWCHNEGVLSTQLQQQIFQGSFSTKGEGRGIGIHGIRLLSENYLQGRVDLISSATTGTVFTITFPIVPKEIPRGQENAPPKPGD